MIDQRSRRDHGPAASPSTAWPRWVRSRGCSASPSTRAAGTGLRLPSATTPSAARCACPATRPSAISARPAAARSASTRVALRPGPRRPRRARRPQRQLPALAPTACSTSRSATTQARLHVAGQLWHALRGVILRLQVSAYRPGPASTPMRVALVPPDSPLYNHPNVHARLGVGDGPPQSVPLPASSPLLTARCSSPTWAGTRGEEIDPPPPGAELRLACFEDRPSTSANAPDRADLRRSGADLRDVPPRHDVGTMGAGVYRNPGCGPCGFPPECEGDYFFSDYYQGFLRPATRLR